MAGIGNPFPGCVRFSNLFLLIANDGSQISYGGIWKWPSDIMYS